MEDIGYTELLTFFLGSCCDKGSAWLCWENTIFPTDTARGPESSFSVLSKVVLVHIKYMAEIVI